MRGSAIVKFWFGRLLYACAVLSVAGAAVPSFADDTKPTTAQGDDKPDADQNQMLLPSLKGLRFVDVVSKLKVNGSDRLGVTVDGPNILYSPGILQDLQQFIGRRFTNGDIVRITKLVKDWYAQRNHPYVDVAFPEQDISNGVIQVVVTEFRAGDIKVESNGYVAPWLIKSNIRLRPGDAINSQLLNDDISYLNQSDFRDVRIVLEKGDKVGATDLVIQTNDKFPLRFSAGYANNGTPLTGRDRWSAGVTWGNAFFLDQVISYQFTSSTDFWLHPSDVRVEIGKSDLAVHSGSWTIPLPWRDRIIFFGNYAQVRPELGPDLGDVGTSWQTSVRYAMPIAIKKWPLQELQFGFDFKRSNNDLEFGGTQISNAQTDIDQFVLTYGAAIPDKWGETKISNRFAYSPGELSSFNTTSAFQPSFTHSGTPFATANYVYNDLSVNRLTKLPLDFGWVTRIEGQFASSNLLPSEALAAGGADSVRGYDEYTASGTNGYLISQEIRSPVISPLGHFLGSDVVADKLQLDVFWDFGYVRNRHIEAGAKPSYYLESAGAGFQYAIDRFVSIRLDYGVRLRTLPGVPIGGQVEASINISN